MQLSDETIKWNMSNGLLKIEPWKDELLQPASVDLTLGTSWQVPISRGFTQVNVKAREAQYKEYETDRFLLGSGQFVLATTHETVTLPTSIAAKFEGKSSLGRMGIMTHITAGFIDPGFSGQITLEIFNASPWALVFDSGIKIGQITFQYLDRAASQGYGHEKWGSRYQGQQGATGVRA